MTSLALLNDVTVVRDERTLLSVDSFEVTTGSRWVVLGPNGSGKTTLLSILSGRLWPTSGTVTLLGQQLGRVDLRELRKRLGFMSTALSKELRSSLLVHDVVVTGADGALEPWWGEYPLSDHDQADRLLSEVGAGLLIEKAFGVVSDGERARVLLARALMSIPNLLCLDEPAAGLDLGAREQLLERLTRVFAAPEPQGVVLVTHHLEEIPPGITHAALMREGQIISQGPIKNVLTSEAISATFEISIEMTGHPGGRFSARGIG